MIFALLDRERAGYIDAHEMAAVLRSSGRTDREAADIVAEAELAATDSETDGGGGGGGHFDFETFRLLVESSLGKTTLKLAARQGAPPPGVDVAVPRHYVVVTLLSILDDYRCVAPRVIVHCPGDLWPAIRRALAPGRDEWDVVIHQPAVMTAVPLTRAAPPGRLARRPFPW